MARGTVALGATGLLVFNIAVRGDVTDHDRVATNAVVLQFLQVRLPDPDWLMKILEGEGLRVMPPILGLYEVLVRKRFRDMAVVACGDAMMTGFHPGVVLIIHDVAILAGRRIVAEVGKTLGKVKGEERQPDKRAEADG